MGDPLHGPGGATAAAARSQRAELGSWPCRRLSRGDTASALTFLMNTLRTFRSSQLKDVSISVSPGYAPLP